MKSTSARHGCCRGAVTGGVGEPSGGLTAGPGEAGGEAGNNLDVLADGPWAGRERGEWLSLLADEGGVSSAPIVSDGLPVGVEKGGDCGRV